MVSMSDFETETTVAEDGSIHLDHAPFPAGSRVRISLIAKQHGQSSASPRHTPEEVNRSRAIVRDMRRKFHIRKYERPDEPVGIEDWSILPDGEK